MPLEKFLKKKRIKIGFRRMLFHGNPDIDSTIATLDENSDCHKIHQFLKDKYDLELTEKTQNHETEHQTKQERKVEKKLDQQEEIREREKKERQKNIAYSKRRDQKKLIFQKNDE